MTNNHNAIAAARDAFQLIDRITHCDCTETLPRTRNCMHFDASIALRDLLIDRAYSPNPRIDPMPALIDDPSLALYDFIRHLLATIDAAPYQTDAMTALLLDNSLCPMHAIDYAICFDDDDPDCAAIRAIHPSHDT